MIDIKIYIKRIYTKYDSTDGVRILIDRLWPRGIKRDDKRIDMWAKDIAPSNELRKWFAHDAEKWSEFKSEYKKELNELTKSTTKILEALKDSNLTLIYSAKDEEHNNAIVLAEFLKNITER